MSFQAIHKESGATVEVVDVKSTTIGGVSQAEFLVYDIRIGRFSWFPSALFSLADGVTTEIPISNINFAQQTYSVEIGKTLTVDAIIIPSDATVTTLDWSIDLETVADIAGTDTSVTITPKVIGSAVISVRAQSGAAGSFTINVIPEQVLPTSIDAVPTSIEAALLEERSITALLAPNNVTNRRIIWSTVDTRIIQIIDEAANICYFQGIGVGTATIRATAAADPNIYAEVQVTIVDASRIASVANYTSLVEASNNPDIIAINIVDDIILEDTVTINHSVSLNGGHHTISFGAAAPKDGIIISANDVIIDDLVLHMTHNSANWQGLYGLQVYNATGVTLNDVTSTGEDGGILINGSEVLINGTIDLSANEFGGMEISRGAQAVRNSLVTINAGATFQNLTEAPDKPTVWVINGQGSLIGGTMFTSVVKGDQTHYYLDSSNIVIPLESISLPATETVSISQRKDIYVTLNPTNTTADTSINAWTWTSSDETVMTVVRAGSSSGIFGRVTASAEGQATITCIHEPTGLTASCIVTAEA